MLVPGRRRREEGDAREGGRREGERERGREGGEGTVLAHVVFYPAPEDGKDTARSAYALAMQVVAMSRKRDPDGMFGPMRLYVSAYLDSAAGTNPDRDNNLNHFNPGPKLQLRDLTSEPVRHFHVGSGPGNVPVARAQGHNFKLEESVGPERRLDELHEVVTTL
eukprot:3214136-Rhodomonas_salina.5